MMGKHGAFSSRHFLTLAISIDREKMNDEMQDVCYSHTSITVKFILFTWCTIICWGKETHSHSKRCERPKMSNDTRKKASSWILSVRLILNVRGNDTWSIDSRNWCISWFFSFFRITARVDPSNDHVGWLYLACTRPIILVDLFTSVKQKLIKLMNISQNDIWHVESVCNKNMVVRSTKIFENINKRLFAMLSK